jgi:hypothetical protein
MKSEKSCLGSSTSWHQRLRTNFRLANKADLSDGFWRVLVKPAQKWNFCHVMPDPPGARARIAVPSALQMGWAKSPACFYAATKTDRDIIDLLLREVVELPGHPLEKFMVPADLPRTAPPKSADQTSIGIYVDDCILAVVENEDRSLIRRVSRAMLHAIHSIFSPPEVSGHLAARTQFRASSWRKGTQDLTLKKRSSAS